MIRCKRPTGWGGHGGPYKHGETRAADASEALGMTGPEVEAWLLANFPHDFEAAGGAGTDQANGGVAAPAKGMSQPPRSKPAVGKTK